MTRNLRRSATLLLLLGVACTSPTQRQSALFAQADEAAAQGDLPRAIARLRSAVSYDPSDVEAVTRLAQALVRADRDREALLILERLPPEVPRNDQFQNLEVSLQCRFGGVLRVLPRLHALEQRGRADPATVLAAIEALAASKTKPSDAPGLPSSWRLALAGHALDGGSPDLAADWLLTSPADAPALEELTDRLMAEVLRAGQPEPSATVVAIAERADTANESLVLRRHLIAGGDWAGVIRIEERFLAEHVEHPAWPEVALAVAWRFLRAGDHLQAGRLADRVAAFDPSSVEPLVVRGLALREEGREVEARKVLELALALEPTNPTARRALSGSERDREAFRMHRSHRGNRPEAP
jgi:tetratricopeptide (TPR) repeat protein